MKQLFTLLLLLTSTSFAQIPDRIRIPELSPDTWFTTHSENYGLRCEINLSELNLKMGYWVETDYADKSKKNNFRVATIYAPAVTDYIKQRFGVRVVGEELIVGKITKKSCFDCYRIEILDRIYGKAEPELSIVLDIQNYKITQYLYDGPHAVYGGSGTCVVNEVP